MQVDQAVDGSLHFSGIILTNLGAHGFSVIRNESQKLKVVTGKEGCRVLRGWKKGYPWACFVQTWLKQEIDLGNC